MGLAMPVAGGVLLGVLLPDSDMVRPDHRTLFALFMGVALSISALPVIAKTLLDLGLFKSDVGLLVMAAAMIDDLIGWLALSLVLGPVRGAAVNLRAFGLTVVLAAVFIVAMLVLGRRLIDAALGGLQRSGQAGAGRVLSLVIVLGLLGASATHVIGLHAVFGAFVVGLAFGGSAKVNARTRMVVEDFVTNIFAPVFFASIGLRTDFVHAFNLPLCAVVFVLATIPKVVGCTLGSRLGGLRWREATAVGFGMNARGTMGIILAAIAHDAGVIGEPMFVALVVMSVGTSLISGPAMKWLLYRERKEEEEDVVMLLRRGAFVSELHATTPNDAIAELVRALGSLLAGRKREARDAVLERERVAPTGLGDEVAIPHAQVDGLDRPLLAFGRSPGGIDFDAPDGKPSRFIFLLLIPPNAYDREVRILASIARATFDRRAREELVAASGIEEVTRVLAHSAKRTRESTRPPRRATGEV
jgi:Kef-type K+ transport system membrane component KefB/mannitol/fructose-specific phosphotransferase system IIA component (Ntr-type)